MNACLFYTLPRLRPYPMRGNWLLGGTVHMPKTDTYMQAARVTVTAVLYSESDSPALLGVSPVHSLCWQQHG